MDGKAGSHTDSAASPAWDLPLVSVVQVPRSSRDLWPFSPRGTEPQDLKPRGVKPCPREYLLGWFQFSGPGPKVESILSKLFV